MGAFKSIFVRGIPDPCRDYYEVQASSLKSKLTLDMYLYNPHYNNILNVPSPRLTASELFNVKQAALCATSTKSSTLALFP